MNEVEALLFVHIGYTAVVAMRAFYVRVAPRSVMSVINNDMATNESVFREFELWQSDERVLCLIENYK